MILPTNSPFHEYSLDIYSAVDCAVWLLMVFVLAGLAILFLGGEVLTRGAVGLAIGLKISPLVVGLTVVSIATSMPEFTASLLAAGTNPGMAMGNILGSNLANTGLILGVASDAFSALYSAPFD